MARFAAPWRHVSSARAVSCGAGAVVPSQGAPGGAGGAAGGAGAGAAAALGGGWIGTLRTLSIHPCTSASRWAAAVRNAVAATIRAAIWPVLMGEW